MTDFARVLEDEFVGWCDGCSNYFYDCTCHVASPAPSTHREA